MKFTELNIPEQVMRGIAAVGFTELTPVQEESIPLALAGKDVAAQAQTGTGRPRRFWSPCTAACLPIRSRPVTSRVP